MPNVLMGLKYQANFEVLESEEQLFHVFADLKEAYEKFKPNFKITDIIGQPVEGLKHLLEIAVSEQPAVTLTGSGDIGGMIVKDTSLEYDLSAVRKMTSYWDISRDGTCHSCRNLGRYYYAPDEGKWYCTVNIDPMEWHDCDKHNARIKNSEGKPARSLKDMIEAAAN